MKKIFTLFICLVLATGMNAQSWLQQGSDINGSSSADGLGGALSFSADGKGLAIGAGSANAGGSLRGLVKVYSWNGSSWSQKGSDIKGAANGEGFGTSVSLDSSGSIVAIGAPHADSAFTAFTNAGLVRIYKYSGSSWVQMGSDITAEASGDNCGQSVSLSNDGLTVAIGGSGNAGGGNSRGHTRVFTWNSSTSKWVQKGSDIDGEDDYSSTGFSVSLDGSGNKLAIGAPQNGANNSYTGHVRVYSWSGSAWIQQGLDIDGDASSDNFGNSVSLSMDGKTLAAGAPQDFMGGYGYVKVFDWSGSTWKQRGSTIASGFDSDEFGYNISLAGNGDYLAIGARGSVTGNEPGRAQIYNWSSSSWTQIGDTIKGKVNYDAAGHSVSLDYSGKWFAIGAPNNNGGGTANGNVRVFNYTTCQQTDSTFTVTTCGSYSWNSKIYSTTGTYYDTLTNTAGCDSVLILKLTISNATNKILTENTCGVYISPSGKVYTTSGTYADTLQNTAGTCDSIIYTINLTKTFPKQESIAASLCGDFYTAPSGRKFNQSGTYKDTLLNPAGNCDSIIYTITLNISIPNVDGLVLKDSAMGTLNGKMAAHGDIDNDGDEDLVVCGMDINDKPAVEIFINDGQGNFTLSSISIPATVKEVNSLSVIDTDGDKFPEIFISGFSNLNTESFFYKNNNGTSFSQVTTAPFNAIYGVKHVFADINNDGFTDLVISSKDSIKLYKNISGTFASTPVALTTSNAGYSPLLAGDINGDGYADILKVGGVFFSSTTNTEVLINDKTGTFTAIANSIGRTMLPNGALGDLDGDKDMDLVLSGADSAFIYTNDGQGNFTLSDKTTINPVMGNVAIVDIDNDGDNDIFLTGMVNYFSGTASYLYLNTGGKFSPAADLPFKNTHSAAAVFFDAGKNGLKNLLLTGSLSNFQGTTDLYTNKGCFAACENFTEVTIISCGPYKSPSGKHTWTEAGTYKDVLTNAAGCDSIITIHLKTKSFSAIAKVACDTYTSPGGKIWTKSGEYTDTLKGANQWGCDSIITISLNISSGIPVSTIVFNEVTGLSLAGVYNSAIAIADMDGDNKPDILLTGHTTGAGPISKLYKNNGGNNFTEVNGTPFRGVGSGSIAIADVDGDNKPDVLITQINTDGEYVTTLYKNNGSNSFTEVKGTPFQGGFMGSITIADVDGDSKPDILITGYTNSHEPIAKLYKNNGGNNFTEVNGTPFAGVGQSSIAIADVDGDSKPDILVTGAKHVADGKGIAKLYKNNGSNNFTEVNGTPFQSVAASSVAIADVDGDNKPDILITGYSGNGTITKLYKNHGSNNFTEVSGTPFQGTYAGSVAIADIDGDNKPEILISGELSIDYGDHRSISKLYKNNGGGKFTEVGGTPFLDVSSCAVAIGDVDGDNKPDILITGSNFQQGKITKLYKNTSLRLTSACIAPTGCNTYTSPSGKYTWTKSGVYTDIIKLPKHDSIITVNLLIDSLNAKFTTQTDPDGNYGLLVINKSKGKGMSFKWSFGDGDSTTGVAPTHTYKEGGTYKLCLTLTTAAGCTETYCQDITLLGKKATKFTIKVIDSTEGSLLVSVEETPHAGYASMAFALYPNPAKEVVNIVNKGTGNFDLIVRDLSGREVRYLRDLQENYTLDLSIVKPGMYIIEVRQDNKQGFYKIIKQ